MHKSTHLSLPALTSMTAIACATLLCGLRSSPSHAAPAPAPVSVAPATTSIAPIKATIKTRDGKSLDGSVHFEAPDVAVISTPDGQTSRVAAANLAALSVNIAPSVVTLPATLPAESTPATKSVSPDAAVHWQSRDIGICYEPGSAVIQDGVLTVCASGWGLWGPADSLHMVYLPVSGPVQIIAHIVSLETTKGTMLAGVGFRESPDSTSPHFSILAGPAGDVHPRARPAVFMAPFNVDIAPALKLWIRLTRNGDRFEVYKSADGQFWEHTSNETRQLPDNVLLGLVAMTRVNAYRETAVLDNIAIIKGIPDVTCFPGSDAPQRGIVLRDGTVFFGEANTADKTQIAFLRGELAHTAHGNFINEPQHFNIPIASVSALIFHQPPAEYLSQLEQPVTPSALLVNGDQIDGNLDSIEQYTLTINSVVLGLKHISIRQECIAAKLAQATHPQGLWTIRLLDGSRFYTQSLKLDRGGITIEHPVFGTQRFAPAEIRSIQAP